MASIDVEMLKAAMQNRREDGFEPEATTEIAERGRAGEILGADCTVDGAQRFDHGQTTVQLPFGNVVLNHPLQVLRRARWQRGGGRGMQRSGQRGVVRVCESTIVCAGTRVVCGYELVRGHEGVRVCLARPHNYALPRTMASALAMASSAPSTPAGIAPHGFFSLVPVFPHARKP